MVVRARVCGLSWCIRVCMRESLAFSCVWLYAQITKLVPGMFACVCRIRDWDIENVARKKDRLNGRKTV